MQRPGIVRARVQKVRADGGGAGVVWDLLAAEEPLEIRIGLGPEGDRRVRTLGVTMRTPGHDEELAVGLLLNERVIGSVAEIAGVGREDLEDAGRSIERIIRVDLEPGFEVDLDRVARGRLTNSSCGVCGSASLKVLNLDGCRPMPSKGPVVRSAVIHRLPEALRDRQEVFDRTGGLHGAALVGVEGGVIAVREDIGRHNAVDKLVGARALETFDGPEAGEVPAILVVSGRVGFEIAQKAAAASLPIIAAVGAPSSLAVEVAESFGLTLLGFVGPERFNIYSGPWRIAP